jgi:Tfp pilus assembly protein FimT
MLIRLSLIIAIVAGLAVAGLSFVKVKEKITTLQTNLQNETDAKTKALDELNTTKRDLSRTQKDLATTRTELDTTKTERDSFQAEARQQRDRATTLADTLAKTQGERDDAQRELTQWALLGVNPDQVRGIMSQNKQLDTSNKNLLAKLDDLSTAYRRATNELNIYKIEDYTVPLPPDLKGKVVVVDPKYDFVVLNIGEKQGVLEHGVLLVSRHGRLVAKIKVRSVQGERSIANVMPGWKLGEVMEGDIVFPQT